MAAVRDACRARQAAQRLSAMLRGLLLSFAYLGFFGWGFRAPFALVLGYLWVDGANPQFLSYGVGLLPMIPVSMIIGIAAIGAYFLMDRREAPRLNAAVVLTTLFAIWCTFTTFVLAEVPDFAAKKWDVAVKTLLFCAFIPYTVRSRVQIEAFLHVLVFSTLVFTLPVGLKTLISGGGYGKALSLVEGNSGLSEGSFLAAVSLMLIPILFYISQHSLILDLAKLRKPTCLGLVIIAIAAAIGTYERTALIGMVVVGGFMWLKSRRKLLFGAFALIVTLVIVYTASAGWSARMATTQTYQQDDSALGRVLVWKWTLGYVASHPFGGGFNAYVIDHIVFPDGSEAFGKAFHSIYFEVLGEQGFPGLLMFSGLLVYTFLAIRRVRRSTKSLPALLWAHDLAGALHVALLTILACGAFIGIGFQPFIYYLVMAVTCLAENVRKAHLAMAEPAITRHDVRILPQRNLAPRPVPLTPVSPAPSRAAVPWRQRAPGVADNVRPG